MTTITIDNRSAEAQEFIEYARRFSFVEVADEPVVRFKPAVERSMRRSLKGKGVKRFNNAEELFADLGI